MWKDFKRRRRTFTSTPIKKHDWPTLNQSQAKIEGVDLAKLQSAHVVIIGAGGIGSNVASALVRKGIGQLTLIDDDHCELSNLTRQLFDRNDVGDWKTVALGRRLAKDAMLPCRIDAYPRRFQELQERSWRPPRGAILLGGVDNNRSRRTLAEYAHDHGHAAIHAAVSGDGNGLYVMVQEPNKACWACAFPHFVDDRTYSCNLGAVIDPLQVVSGLMVYAVDTLISSRHREWNVMEMTLDGGMPPRSRTVAKRSGCPVCGVNSQTIINTAQQVQHQEPVS